MKKALLILTVVTSVSLSGCWLAAGAAGAEAGYVGTRDRTVGETISDQTISTSVKSALLADPEVSGMKINVDVKDAVVQLRGYVNSQHEIDRAVEIAKSTKGVRSVDSRLVLDRRS